MASDVLGRALLDYQNGNYSEDIKTFSSLDEEDVLALPYLFREYENMPVLEQKALTLCKGRVLDIGAGAGSHSLYLQEKGFDITALDTSPGAVETCRLRGLKQVVQTDIFEYKTQTFDTLLMLMNGIGLVGTLPKLDIFFKRLKPLLRPGGQLLLDASDIIYMFEEDVDGGRWVPDRGSYYGEVEFTLQYKKVKSEPFFWLYVDYRTLESVAAKNGLHCDLVSDGEHFDYLARIWAK